MGRPPHYVLTRPIRERNTITLPKRLLDQLGIGPGDYVAISIEDQKLILAPQHLYSPLSPEDWTQLDNLAGQKGKIYSSADEARKHLRKLKS